MSNSQTFDFVTAFAALTGYEPLPWQAALFEDWFVKGEIPSACDIPTGLGKTSVVAIWLMALANHPDELPRRLVYVVNRRTVVDQTTNEVENLRTKIRDADLHESLSRLCAIPLTNDEPPLAISTLRGQFADNREWMADPSRPAVIVGTVDMIGSRLLFNGYRAGSWQLARHAGLIGHDALVVHDEAHLEPTFQKLIEWIEKRQSDDGSLRRLRVMAMSATGRANSSTHALSLSDHDLQHAVVKQRFSGVQKVLCAHDPGPERLPDQLVEQAWKHAGTNVRVIVYVRQPDHAGKVRDGLLAKLKSDAERGSRVALLTGTIRGYERDQLLVHPAVHGLLHSYDDNGQRIAPPHTTWLVTTSAGEVGADFDADHLVCDLSPMDSMIQRFGRVNRRGGKGRVARIDVMLDRPEQKKNRDGTYRDLSKFDQARHTTADLLAKLPPASFAVDNAADDPPPRNASPEALRNLVKSYPEEYTKASSPEPPSMTPHDVILDAWSLTSIQDDWPLAHDVHPYLHGLDPQAPRTVVAWRAEIDQLPKDEDIRHEDGDKFMRDVLRHYPFRPLELLREKPRRVAELLVALRAREPRAWIVLRGQRSLSTLRLKDLPDDAKTIAPQLHYRTVLLPPSLGGLNGAGMLEDPSADATVRDVADLIPIAKSNEYPADRHRVLLSRNDDNQWSVQVLSGENLPQTPSVGEPAPTYSKWTEARDAVTRSLNMKQVARFVLAEADDGPMRMLLLLRAREPSTAAQENVQVTITAHNQAVLDVTNRMIERLRLEPALQGAFKVAASNHDLGKADSRWQAAIRNDDVHHLLAKSYGKGFDWRALDGYRHEFGSLLAVVHCLPDDEARDLVLHLIAAHHGRGRPHFDESAMAIPGGLPDDLPDLLQPAEVARRFARLQRRFGHWGLAWLESILMAADAEGSKAPADAAPDEIEEDEE